MPRLNKDERNQAIGILNAGMSATVVSRHFGGTQKTIQRLRRPFRVTGNAVDRPGSGRPRVTTAVDDRYIILQHLRNRRLTAAATGRQYGIHPDCQKSVETKRSTFSCVPTVLLSNFHRHHRTARRDWCCRHLHFRPAKWNLILFSDRCRFNLSHVDGHEKVYRRRGDRLPICASLSGTLSELV